MQSDATLQELLAEKERLESLLESSADWRALHQLEARLDNQQPLQAVSHDALAARLRLTLSDNPFYQKRERVLASLQQVSEGKSAPEVTVLQPRHPQRSTSTLSQHTAAPAFDDLTKIRNINRGLALSLNALGVVRYAQIRDWSAADVAIIRFALKLGSRISTENWIEQAALLSFTSDSSAHTHPAPVPGQRARLHATASDPQTTPSPSGSNAHEGLQDTSFSDKYPIISAVTSFAMTREGPSITSDLKPPLPLVPSLYLLAVSSQPKRDAFEAEHKEASVLTVPEMRLPPAADVPRPLPAHAFAMPEFATCPVDQAPSPPPPSQLQPVPPVPPPALDDQQVQRPTSRQNGKVLSARRRAPVEVRAAALGRTGEEAAVEIVRRDRQTGRPPEPQDQNAADAPGAKSTSRGGAFARMFPFRSRSQS